MKTDNSNRISSFNLTPTYLIEVIDRERPRLHGPFYGHVDTGDRCLKEQGWEEGPGIPNWVRGNDKLYRVTSEGIIELLEAMKSLGHLHGGYISDHHKKW